jgi:starch synthase
MYQALEMAVSKTGKSVVLVECGWHANEFIAKAYAEAATLACPGVKVMQLDGRVQEQRQLAWAAADVFCSLSDNIQETFGITPIEAMAAGLPVVVSDWDGYKDTVRHGVDGFRVTTTAPPPGLGQDLAFRHAVGADSYDMYCGHACSFISVDIQAASEAFVMLFQSGDLRIRMGAAGRQRAVSYFDWSTVIGQYEALWKSLQTMRIAACQASNSHNTDAASPDSRRSLHEAAVWPARLDPLTAFSCYPTSVVTTQHFISARFKTTEEGIARLQSLRALAMVRFADTVLMDEKSCAELIRLFVQPVTRIGDILQRVEPKAQGHAFRSLVNLAKLGLISIIEAPLD